MDPRADRDRDDSLRNTDRASRGTPVARSSRSSGCGRRRPDRHRATLAAVLCATAVATIAATSAPIPAGTVASPTLASSSEGSGAASAEPAAPAARRDGIATTLPAFSLLDPEGRRFDEREACGNGAILVVTMPNIRNGPAQNGWFDLLRDTDRVPAARVVFLEDMTDVSLRALKIARMRQMYDPAREPLLLLDEGGVVRRALGAPENRTTLLVYGPDGRLVHVDRESPSRAGVLEAWKRLEASIPKKR